MWKVTVVWDDERPREERTEVYEYRTKKKAERVAEGYRMAFGNQLWVGVHQVY